MWKDDSQHMIYCCCSTHWNLIEVDCENLLSVNITFCKEHVLFLTVECERLHIEPKFHPNHCVRQRFRFNQLRYWVASCTLILNYFAMVCWITLWITSIFYSLWNILHSSITEDIQMLLHLNISQLCTWAVHRREVCVIHSVTCYCDAIKMIWLKKSTANSRSILAYA